MNTPIYNGLLQSDIDFAGFSALNAGSISGVITQNLQNDDYTLVIGDAGKHIFHSSATPHAYTIPANASVEFEVGTAITIVNNSGAGTITLAITSDTLRRGDGVSGTGSRTIAASSIVTVIKIQSTVWMIGGVFT